jgi:hypothetical protein
MRKRLRKSKQDKVNWLSKKAPYSVSLIVERGTYQSKRLLAKDEYSNIIELASGSHKSLLSVVRALRGDLQETVSNIQFRTSGLGEAGSSGVSGKQRHFGRVASDKSLQDLVAELQHLCLETNGAGGGDNE